MSGRINKQAMARRGRSFVTAVAALCAAFPFASAFGANPFLPAWEHIPDGEPRVFGDRVYLYGSHDRAGSHRFCDYLLKVWSAPLDDLNHWTDDGISFATRDQPGHADDVPWSDNELYAPDVVEKGGKYYLYFYVVGAPGGVAVSDAPTGPFKLVSKIVAPPGAPRDFGGWGQYADPGVLVDDDGRVYLYWGYKRSYMAELDPQNMYAILPGTYQEDPIPAAPPFNYFEASSMRKINGTYYYIYAAGGTLVYATGKSPRGPFVYGGPIITNGHDYPGGNIHGSLCNLNGQWYIFYHRMTNDTIFSRKACAERVTIAPDGSIKQVEQTSLGFQDALDPYQRTPADIACVLTGGNYITQLDRTTHPVVHNRNGSVIGFKYFDFGPAGDDSPLQLAVRFRSGAATGRMEIRLDDPHTGPQLGAVPIDGPDDGQWHELTTSVAAVAGRHAIYFSFISEDRQAMLGELESFGFARQKRPPEKR